MASVTPRKSEIKKLLELIQEKEEKFCVICYNNIIAGKEAFTNECIHVFCFHCIERWSQEKCICPLCRTSFNQLIYKIRSVNNYLVQKVAPMITDSNADQEWTSNQSLQFNFMRCLSILLNRMNLHSSAADLIVENDFNEEIYNGRRRVTFVSHLWGFI